MLFNSLSFLAFFPLVYILYWIVFKNNLRRQNIMLMLASYYFYGCWDWRFLFLLAFSTFLDFYTGLKIHKSENDSIRKIWLIVSVGINLGFLGVFKYYNFFASSFANLLDGFGFQINPGIIEVVLPVGISFYTFHGLSYVFDIYSRKIQPSEDFVNYSLFVSFFPLLVAGPIERATHLLPQIEVPRKFNLEDSKDGLRQILWGLFKKVVIADNCASVVNPIFEANDYSSGSTLMIGAILFAFQIYCDFSGYSDIALGTARLLGFELLRNFAYPYFSRDIAEFWRRWHISLSSWFRDYLYFPLGGSRLGKLISMRNTLIIFTVSGFWHGANWTFIVWGIYHGLLFLPLLILNRNRSNTNIVAENKWIFSPKEFLQMLLTFTLVVIGWILFRAENITQSMNYLMGMFDKSILSLPVIIQKKEMAIAFSFILVLLSFEWLNRRKSHGLNFSDNKVPKIFRTTIYVFLVWMIIWFNGNQEEFIYFQF
jgi:alginate O-acetyltransferase complex protein AlgI